MTDADRHYSDEDLTAFLDGEAPRTLARALEADVPTDSRLAARLDALDISKSALRDAFTVDLASAPPMPNLPPAASITSPPQTSRRWIGTALGFGAGIAAGLAVAVSLDLAAPTAPAAPASGGWLATVATYQMLYTSETLAQAEPGDPATLAALSDVINLDLSGLAQIDGLEFRRAQRLGFNGKALIQVAYALPDGTPFAICILQSTKAARGAEFKELKGMQAADWTTGQHGILLIGGADKDVLRTLTPEIQTLL